MRRQALGYRYDSADSASHRCCRTLRSDAHSAVPRGLPARAQRIADAWPDPSHEYAPDRGTQGSMQLDPTPARAPPISGRAGRGLWRASQSCTTASPPPWSEVGVNGTTPACGRLHAASARNTGTTGQNRSGHATRRRFPTASPDRAATSARHAGMWPGPCR